MNAVTQTVAAEPVSGVEIFVPLAKLKKSPRNARKVPHGEAAIEALTASIEHNGLIQNLVIEPEVKEDGTPTGYYLVTAGEGRRLAMLQRAKRKQIKKSEPVRCWLDTANDPSEISLDENVTRTPMHPADQFERFAELSNDKPGQRVCRIGAVVSVDARPVVVARERDGMGRPLPVWQGCRTLRAGELLMLNPDHADSMDGRYFGPLPATTVLGRATPILTRDTPDAPLTWR